MYGTELALSPVTTMSITHEVYVGVLSSRARELADVFTAELRGESWPRAEGQSSGMSTSTFGGHRLVRQLGASEHAVVHLAYPHDDMALGGPVAIKIFRAETPGELVMTEIEALSRAAGEHCVRLLDLATGLDGSCGLI